MRQVRKFGMRHGGVWERRGARGMSKRVEMGIIEGRSNRLIEIVGYRWRQLTKTTATEFVHQGLICHPHLPSLLFVIDFLGDRGGRT